MMGFDDIDAAIVTGIFLIGLLLVAVVWRLSAGASDRDTHVSGDSDEEIDRVEAIKKQIGATWERALKRLTFNLIDVFVR